ncbi:hypothetical protein MEA186_15432 [Mesorhizobium amorphae CCNWGS0123]|uniref:Uncharacterized protein n=1 Tax=Mesorhizobium amorphae CCNWGS0123 TaxID=1082933 RepID=G6YAW4_9HYPH|nr:hypothetical protein MEA186_15432 [Mesorhizobium amorphae CCNWGS0123]
MNADVFLRPSAGSSLCKNWKAGEFPTPQDMGDKTCATIVASPMDVAARTSPERV